MAGNTPPLRKSKHFAAISGEAPEWRTIANHGLVFDIGDDLEPFAKLCRSAEGLADAVGMLSALAGSNERTAGFEKAVYVIQVADDPICKIGISANPLKRLEDLQAAHYRELFLYAVIFCPGRKSMTIEQAVLEEAGECGERLMGEWIARDPHSVLLSALAFARDLKIDVNDGETWFSNMVTRTKELYSHQRERTRLARRMQLRRKIYAT